jgi:hypothetical protein
LSDSVLFTVTSIPSSFAISTFSLAPNPASETVTLSGVDNVVVLYIVDAIGRTVYKQEGTGLQKIEIPVQSLPAGSYVVKGITKSGLAIGRFIKK